MKVTFELQKGMKQGVGTVPAYALAAVLMASIPVGAATIAPAVADEKAGDADCSALLEQGYASHAFQLVRAQLQAQGMRLIAQGCPYVRVAAGSMQQVLDVRVEVVNSDIAAQFVRGPLADGQEVDMGGVQFAMPPMAHNVVHSVQEEVSPDVIHNRQWLAAVMQSRGLQPVPGHWWAFTPAEKK